MRPISSVVRALVLLAKSRGFEPRMGHIDIRHHDLHPAVACLFYNEHAKFGLDPLRLAYTNRGSSSNGRALA